MRELLQSIGYTFSTLSVLLLGVVAWPTASESRFLGGCLIAGMVVAIVGMICRWISFLRDRKQLKAVIEDNGQQQPEPRLPTRPADGRAPEAGPRGLDRPQAGTPHAYAAGGARAPHP
jgi:4-amino-4-deoxy-L-arabinose transferase-like glycosyltransferase